MPIAATTTALASALQGMDNSGVAGTPVSTSTLLTSAIASVAPSGLFPAGLALIPLPPAGFAATQSILNSVFNMGVAGTPAMTSQVMASAIAALCPIVPPTGMAALQAALQSIANMGVAGTPSATSQIMATAIVSYFMMGMVI
jgi:hypothetical protein